MSTCEDKIAETFERGLEHVGAGGRKVDVKFDAVEREGRVWDFAFAQACVLTGTRTAVVVADNAVTEYRRVCSHREGRPEQGPRNQSAEQTSWARAQT